MNAQHVLNHLINSSGKSRRAICRSINRSGSFLSVLIHKKSTPFVDTLALVCAAVGKAVVLVPDGTALPIDSITID